MDEFSTLTRFTQAFEQLNLEEMMTCFSENATAFFPAHHHPTRINGKKELTLRFRNVLKKIRDAGHDSISLPVQDLELTQYGAVTLATFHIRDNDLSRRTIILEKTDETWGITHLHASNAPLEDAL